MSQNNDAENKKLTAKRELSPDHMLIAYWAANRFEVKEIAKELGFTEATVKRILKDEDVRLLIKKVQFKLFGEDPALHIKSCAAKGITIADEIMTSKKTKDHTRQEIAFKFMDRAYGKPGIEDGMVEGTVRKILQVLVNNQNPIDLNQQKTKDDIEDADYSELPQVEKPKEEPKEVDKVDDWIDKNIT